jgi:hypothetical protein
VQAIVVSYVQNNNLNLMQLISEQFSFKHWLEKILKDKITTEVKQKKIILRSSKGLLNIRRIK